MKDQSLYRLPPQSIEAEESLLSRIIIDSEVLVNIVDILLPNDFYRSAHQKIFSGIMKLFIKKEPIDLITVTEILKEIGVLSEVGGATYIATLVEAVPLAVNAEHYAKIIKKASVARQLIVAANDIAKSAYEANGDIVDVLDSAQSRLININLDIGSVGYTTSAELIMQRIPQIEKMSKEGKTLGIQTGFSSFDLLTGGLRGSKFCIIAARPRIGKTAFMMNITNNIAASGHKVGIFSIEMEKEELVDRQISSKSGVNLTKLSSGRGITPDDWVAIHGAGEVIYNYQIVIDDTGGLRIQELKRRARQMLKDGVEIIFIDQLSKIRGGKGNGEYEKRSYIVNEIATLAKELRIPICLLAQINRNVEDRQNKKPTLGDLKSTGSLEEDADIILLGHRDYEYTKNEEDMHHAEWELAKNKQGATTNMEMYWIGKTVTFSLLHTGK